MRIEVTDSSKNLSTSEKRKRLIQKSKSVKHDSMRISRSHNEHFDYAQTDDNKILQNENNPPPITLSPMSRPPEIDTNDCSPNQRSLLSPTPTPQFRFLHEQVQVYVCDNLLLL